MDTSPKTPARSIIVGADGSDASNLAVTWAAREAVTTGATLRIVNVWSIPFLMWPATAGFAYVDPADVRVGAVAILDQARALAINAAHGITLEVEIAEVQGGAAEQLVAQSADADLLVVGTRGHGGFARLVLGSVATACAHHSSVPLAVIGPDAPPPGESTGEETIRVCWKEIRPSGHGRCKLRGFGRRGNCEKGSRRAGFAENALAETSAFRARCAGAAGFPARGRIR